MNRRDIAIQHVAFEGLGSPETMLASRGYDPTILDACREALGTYPVRTPATHRAALLVVLGGPIGANEEDIR